jgi:hypothetical protein
MLDQSQFRAIMDRCAYPGFHFMLGSDRSGDHYLQVQCYDGQCNVTGQNLNWTGRKWRLSPHMTPSEVVQTVFKAVMTAIEHETRERFTYRDVSIFDPHYDVERLVELRRDSSSISERDR